MFVYLYLRILHRLQKSTIEAKPTEVTGRTAIRNENRIIIIIALVVIQSASQTVQAVVIETRFYR